MAKIIYRQREDTTVTLLKTGGGDEKRALQTRELGWAVTEQKFIYQTGVAGEYVGILTEEALASSTVDAPGASKIGFYPGESVIAATTVQGALEEMLAFLQGYAGSTIAPFTDLGMDVGTSEARIKDIHYGHAIYHYAVDVDDEVQGIFSLSAEAAAPFTIQSGDNDHVGKMVIRISTPSSTPFRLQVGDTDFIHFVQGNPNIGPNMYLRAPVIEGNLVANDDAPGGYGIFWTNASNASSIAHSTLMLQTGGASGGDPSVVLGVSGGSTWSMGVDNSDSDKFKIGYSGGVGTNTVLTFSSSSLVIAPLITPTLGLVFSGGTSGQGRIIGSTTNGLEIRALNPDGATNALAILSADGAYLFENPISTNNVKLNRQAGTLYLGRSGMEVQSLGGLYSAEDLRVAALAGSGTRLAGATSGGALTSLTTISGAYTWSGAQSFPGKIKLPNNQDLGFSNADASAPFYYSIYSTPSNKLHFAVGNFGGPATELDGSGNWVMGAAITTAGNILSTGGVLQFGSGTAIGSYGRSGFELVTSDLASGVGSVIQVGFAGSTGNVPFQMQPYFANGGAYGNLNLTPLGGNVGIRNASPGYPLDVVGDTKISGHLGLGAAPQSEIMAYFRTSVSAVGGQSLGLAVLPTFSSVTNAYVADFQALVSGATIPNLWTVYLENPGSGGTITNNIALQIASQTRGTNNWAIKTVDGLVEFGDQVHIGGHNTLEPHALTVIGGPSTAGQGLLFASSLSNNTTKDLRIKAAHYSNSEEPMTTLWARTGSSTNVLNIGGGLVENTAATTVNIWTAAGNTDLTGTIRAYWDSAGGFTQLGNAALGFDGFEYLLNVDPSGGLINMYGAVSMYNSLEVGLIGIGQHVIRATGTGGSGGGYLGFFGAGDVEQQPLAVDPSIDLEGAVYELQQALFTNGLLRNTIV